MGKAHRLKAKTVDGIKEPGVYCDGAGLYLQVKETGSKSWVFRYMLKGRARWMGLGPLPDVSLAEARDKAALARKTLRDEKADPLEKRRASDAEKQEARAADDLAKARSITFADAAREYIKLMAPGWKNAKHAGQWTNTIEKYVNPIIGGLPVDSIDTALVRNVLAPIWTEKPETAARVRGRIESILDWAKVAEHRSGENPARLRGHLEHSLAKMPRSKRVKHHPALPFSRVAEFMRDLRRRPGVSAKALEFVILTACRSGEARLATWGEIDLDAATWTIPSGRMKAGKEHAVALPEAAVALLKDLPQIDAIVFPGARSGKPLSDMALTALIRRMDEDSIAEGGSGWRDHDGRTITAHGFRSAFRDWAGETTDHPREVIEHALAHQLKDKAEAAYQRGTLWPKRVGLMSDWGKYCNG